MKWRDDDRLRRSRCARRSRSARAIPTKPVKVVVPFTRRQRDRHPRAHRRAEAVGDVGPAGGHREPAGRRRHDRRGRRRQVAGRRLHAARAFGRRTRCNRVDLPDACPTTRSRTSSRSRTLGGQPNVLVVAPSTGFTTTSPISSLRRRRRPARSTSRSAGIGSGTHINAREVQARRGHRRRAHSVQGHARGADRHDDRPRDVLLLADLGGAAEHSRRQAGRARRVDGEALERAAERADDRRGRAAGIRLQPVGRHVRAGRHAGRHRRQDQRGRRQRRSRRPTCASGSRRSAPSRWR